MLLELKTQIVPPSWEIHAIRTKYSRESSYAQGEATYVIRTIPKKELIAPGRHTLLELKSRNKVQSSQVTHVIRTKITRES